MLNRHAHHSAATRLDRVATHDLILRPVGTLDQNVGLTGANDLGRCVLVEDDDGVHALQCRQHFSSFCFRVDRPIRSLVPSHRRIRVQADDKHVAQRAGLLEIAKVTGVEQIEDAIGKNDNGAGGTPATDQRSRMVSGQQPRSIVLGLHWTSAGELASAIPSEKRQAWRGR